MLADFSRIRNLQEFLEAANNEAAAWPMSSIEFNVPATLVMLVDTARHAGRSLDTSSVMIEAETGMLQIALLNQGINPGSPFLNAAQSAGWRYRPNIGFYKEDDHD